MRKFIIKRVISSLLLIIFIFFSNVSALAVHDDLKGGAILHAWCWSFKTIKDHIPDIKAAGYDAVQVSPPQESYKRKDCLKCNGDCKCIEQNWFYFYQPTNFKIGNLLGTKEEFKEMCDVAKECEVKVIVDIVANHVAKEMEEVSPNIKTIPNVFHGGGGLPNNPDRFEMTHCDLLGLHSLNTHNKEVQKMIKNYMNDCLKCGVSGFRYDAAKHIELPKEIDKKSGREFGSDFWSNITKNAADKEAKWQYGEVLQDGLVNFKGYSEYMDVTASKYGKKIRDAIRDKRLDHNDIMDYDREGVEENKLVTWVESHDNYANSKKFEGENVSFELTDEQIKLGWAIVAGRAAGVPLFFSRPNSNLVSKIKAQDSYDKQYYDRIKFDDSLKFDNMGENCTLFKDPCIVAINTFRKFMKDEDEYLRNPDNNNLLIIERGTQNKRKYQGAIIINQSEELKIDSRTKLEVGKYIDILSGKTFTVEKDVYDQEIMNGKPVDSGRNGLSGKIGGKISILVNKSDVEELKPLFFQEQQSKYHFE